MSTATLQQNAFEFELNNGINFKELANRLELMRNPFESCDAGSDKYSCGENPR